MANFVLNNSVPDTIAIHFETAKNIYLYAWFVFRFYPVAEQHAFSTLEFALRECQQKFVKEYMAKHSRNSEPGLGALLRRAIKNGLVRNEKFRMRENWAHGRAIARYQQQLNEKMISENLTKMEVNYSAVVATDEDLNHDWLKDFLDSIPHIRNQYAHGSGMLYHSVLHTFEVVSELINQLFPERHSEIAPTP
ncbi:MAG TPA: hypothetical protein VI338_02975 [Nitrososphaera sp.]|nr:hypothetical protein [Nitrososphaera sp.]